MATEFNVVKNNAVSTLAAEFAAGATSLTVAAGEGAKFPSTFPFNLSIEDEIIKVEARSTDTLSSITRAQEGTSDATHASGKAVELRVTAKSTTDLNAAVNTLEAASHTKYTDAEARAAVPFLLYIPLGSAEDGSPVTP